MTPKRKKAKLAAYETMSEDELMTELANIITADLIRITQVVIEHRMKLWTREVMKNVKKLREQDR